MNRISSPAEGERDDVMHHPQALQLRSGVLPFPSAESLREGNVQRPQVLDLQVWSLFSASLPSKLHLESRSLKPKEARLPHRVHVL